jgi:hypothetical protein
MPARPDTAGARRRAKKGPHVARLPGFLSDGDVGLGDLIKRTTSALGIRPCGGCERRAATLDRWLVFSPRKRG